MLFSSRIGAVFAVACCLTSQGNAQQAYRLKEVFQPGHQYHVSVRVDLTGKVTLPPDKDNAEGKTLDIAGDSAIEYDERILDVDRDQVRKSVRVYRRIDLRRKVGDRPQEATIRPQVRRLVLLRLQSAEVPFSPDGPLTWGEIDLIRTDVFTPALAGMFPQGEVRVGDRWTAGTSAIQELTDMEKIEEGQIECRLDEITIIEKRRHARISLNGTVRGVNEDGPSQQKLDGYFYFDLESNHLSYLSLKGIHTLKGKDGKALGNVEGRFVMTRQSNQRCRELGDEALRGVVLEPNDDNTLLLYENDQLGVRLLHPRRWRVAGVRGSQLAIDEAEGSGLLLTVEPRDKVPTGAKFMQESQDYLKQQKAEVLRSQNVRKVQDAPKQLENFTLEVNVNKEQVLMEYFVLLQEKAGGTIAARIVRKDQDKIRDEVHRIARSIEFK